MEIIALDNTRRSRNLRVAAYARVSTDTEEQKSSYDSQVGYFTELIQNNPKWDFVEVYADLGKSGLKAEMRPDFLRMIEDAKAGKMDVILVKSISRFARNSLEAQEFAHLLKEYDVEVRFEREGLSTFDPQAEMIFDFLTAVAEQESKSVSENTSWALKRLAEQGIRHLGNNRVLGYDEIDGVLTPNEQAWIPRLIFMRFAEGKSYCEIANELEEKEAGRIRSKNKYAPSQFLSILGNEIYVGDRQIQKKPHIDWKTKKPKWGEAYESFYVEEHHEGVISRELWDKVQERLKREENDRNNGIYKRPNSHFLFGRILCGECGEPMIRRVAKSNGNETISWICKDRRKGKNGNGCKNLIIPEDELLEALTLVLGQEWNGVESVDEKTFEKIRRAKIYEDGKINVELYEESKTA